MMALDLNRNEADVVNRAAEFADRCVYPRATAWEAGTESARRTLTEAAGAELLGLLVPDELGGLGLRPSVMAAAVDVLAARDFFFTFALVVHNNLANALARNGSAYQRDAYLPDLLSGARIGAFLLTEPDAGSDAAAITTHAAASGDGWLLDGRKAWISNADHAGLLSVYARTSAEPGSAGIAAFLVEAETPGVVVEDRLDLPAARALGVAGVRFHSCRLGREAAFLPPGRAFKAAMEGIDLARVMVAAMCCGILDDSLSRALDYSRQRRAFGRTLYEHQGLSWMLADVATDLAAARALTREAAWRLDKGLEATLHAAHAKKFATRVAQRGVAECMQVHGANGLHPGLPLMRHLTAARTAQYLDGTTEIQNVVIARALGPSAKETVER